MVEAREIFSIICEKEVTTKESKYEIFKVFIDFEQAEKASKIELFSKEKLEIGLEKVTNLEISKWVYMLVNTFSETIEK